tara:strand:- start:724 stop:1197 length:474 start_codon:yes stop_codon:yes gene_type:complete
MFFRNRHKFSVENPLSSGGMRNALNDFFNGIRFRPNDPLYAPVTVEQMQLIWSELQRDCRKSGLPAYKLHDHDCDDILLTGWKWNAHKWWYRNCKTRGVVEGTGSFHYTTRNGFLHYAVWRLTPDYEIDTWNYYNGNRDLVLNPLTRKELSTADQAY